MYVAQWYWLGRMRWTALHRIIQDKQDDLLTPTLRRACWDVFAGGPASYCMDFGQMPWRGYTGAGRDMGRDWLWRDFTPMVWGRSDEDVR
jgi:hypothetical protein